MCGLAGVARVDGGPLDDATEPVLRRMLRALRHRGPDDERLLLDDQVGLAFTRLSLVDPEGGGQPLVSPDGSVVLIANGEIYNHEELAAGLPPDSRPRTRSDCEVLVHLYQRDGLRFLDQVRGMFSLVLWDRRERRLLLAKDRFGVKPLLYHRNRRRIVFGSEVKALFEEPECPRRLDWELALTDQAMTGAATYAAGGPVSWYEEIEHVPPATILDISLHDGTMSAHRYWRLPDPAGEEDRSDADLIELHRELLRSSVEESCMADVEIGLFLSGGIDSAAVAAFASRKLTPHTFTTLSASAIACGDAPYGHRVAGALGLPNHQVLFERDRIPGVDEWRRLLWLVEMPQCGPEQFYKYELHRFVKSEYPDIKAMLLGGGADEYNGGYTTSFSNGQGWDGFLSSISEMARNRAFRARPDLAHWNEDTRFPLLTDAALELYSGVSLADPYTAFLTWKHRDVALYNCWHEDRTAAGNGIEARVPFLDHRLVELLAGLPPSTRARLLWDKRILRDGLVGILPDDVVNRPKVAFYHENGVEHVHRTFVRMLAQDGGALVEEAMAAPRARELLNADGARAMLATLTADCRAGHVERLLRVVNLGLLDQLTRSLPTPPVDAGAVAVARAVPVEDWTAAHDDLVAMTTPRPAIHETSTPARAGNVLLLNDPVDADTWYVAVDGTIEYVVNRDEEPEWLRFLLAVDGKCDLGSVLAAASTDLDTVGQLLTEAVDLGVLVLSDGLPVPDPGPDAVPVRTLASRIRRHQGTTYVAGPQQVFELTDTAAFVFRHIDGKRTVRDIGHLLATEYGTDTKTAIGDIAELLADLVEQDVVEFREGGPVCAE